MECVLSRGYRGCRLGKVQLQLRLFSARRQGTSECGRCPRDPVLHHTMRQLSEETASVACALGIHQPDDIVERSMRILDIMLPDGTSSMEQDVEAGEGLRTGALRASLPTGGRLRDPGAGQPETLCRTKSHAETGNASIRNRIGGLVAWPQIHLRPWPTEIAAGKRNRGPWLSPYAPEGRATRNTNRAFTGTSYHDRPTQFTHAVAHRPSNTNLNQVEDIT